MSLLYELRDTLWQAYGSEITEHYQQLYTKKTHAEDAGPGEHQLVLFDSDQDDVIPF